MLCWDMLHERDGDIDIARENRNTICDILDIPKPKMKTTGLKPKKPERNELDSYQGIFS